MTCNAPPRRRRSRQRCLARVRAGAWVLAASIGVPPIGAQAATPAAARSGIAGNATLARAGDTLWLEGERGHTTQAIRALDTHTGFVFLETAHFRIAASFTNYKLTDPDDKKRLPPELGALRRLGYKVPKTTAVVDGALRAHIYALRLERLYSDCLQRLDVDDKDFPSKPDRREKPGYMGEGPYLGMRQRFLVMLCEDEATLARYCSAYLGRSVSHNGLRHFFTAEGAQFFGIAARGQHQSFETDRALHAATVYSVSHVLLDAFKYYWHETPYWLQEGFAHWQRRLVDEDSDHYTFLPVGLPEKNRELHWPTSTRLRTLQGNFTPMRETVQWLDDRAIDFGDHLAIWSRVDFLLTKHPKAFGLLLRAIKGPEPKGPSISPTPERVVERQIEALQRVLGFTPDEFDAAWCAYAKESYPRR